MGGLASYVTSSRFSDPPVIDTTPADSTVFEGNNVTLHCNATGKPEPIVSWTKDANSTVLHQGETFSIANVQREASGDYMCTAWNAVGECTM